MGALKRFRKLIVIIVAHFSKEFLYFHHLFVIELKKESFCQRFNRKDEQVYLCYFLQTN